MTKVPLTFLLILGVLLLTSCQYIPGLAVAATSRASARWWSPPGERARDPNPENYNIYLSGSYNHQRESGDKTIYER